METHKLAVILKNPSNDDEFLLLKQKRPPEFSDREYDSYVDSDLWDLPSAQLNLVEGETKSKDLVKFEGSLSEEIDWSKFDISTAIGQSLEQLELGVRVVDGGEWKFWKYVKEAAFGPGSPIHTVFFTGKLLLKDQDLQDSCKWVTVKGCLNWLLEVKPGADRVGPLAVVGLVNDSMPSVKQIVPPTISYQDYPPGVTLIPMGSRTQKPFHTTNLIVFAPEKGQTGLDKNCCIARGDALIVDPGCQSEFYGELEHVVSSLPRKLIVFVTHHHHDHVDGLSIVQKCNPEATLLAHENTIHRIGKGDWSLGHITVSGSESICIGDQRLHVIFAPGHTDGHMALLHVNTHSLVVGDHCVGQGSAVLDITSGGNMTEYFQSTYKFLELSPHALIPMHGRVNLWPRHMLCGYLKNRRTREASILKAIEDGAKTLFDIVAVVYSEVGCSFWIPAASNVRLHVDHLAQQHKLPKDFSLENFKSSLVEFADEVGKFETQ